MDELIAQTGLTGVVLLSLYYGIRFLYLWATREQRQAKAEEKLKDERETWIKRENDLRAELSAVYEQKQQQERAYLEQQITRLENQIESDRVRHEREVKTQQKSLSTLEETYQRLADRAQADKLLMEGHLEQQESKIQTLTLSYERSEKEREELLDSLKATQAELRQTKEVLAELKIDKVVLERTNALLEQQLDVLRGLVEPMRNWMAHMAA